MPKWLWNADPKMVRLILICFNIIHYCFHILNLKMISNEATNSRYHVPRSWLNPSGNLLVVFEEWGGDPRGISLVKRTK